LDVRQVAIVDDLDHLAEAHARRGGDVGVLVQTMRAWLRERTR
jgi:hypothetical protein